MAQRQISPGRKVVFYSGVGVTVFGFLMFISAFISAASGFGNASTVNGSNAMGSTSMMSAALGMLMMILGGFLTRAGRMGLSGSGVVLDPEGARRDVEPWARMAGGVVKDAMDEAGVRIDGKRAAGEKDEASSSSSSSSLPFDERLRRLEKLRAEGLVNEAEYAAARKRILEGV